MNKHVARIVASYVRKNRPDAGALPELIMSVKKTLAGLGQPEPFVMCLTPAVPIRRSIRDDVVVCLECGFEALMLKRHLMMAHALTPTAYREKWRLPVHHPLVAKNYAARRSALAKSLGFGRNRRTKSIGTEQA